MREFYPAISVACLQLHHHIIPFLPIESQLSQVYGPRLQSGVNIKQRQAQTWAPCVSVLEGHTNGYAVAFSPDGGQLVTGSDDHTIWLWNVQTGALLHIMTGHTVAVVSLAYSSDGMLLASGSYDHTVRIWDVETGLQVGMYTGHSDNIWSVAFSENGLCIASGDADGQVHVWSIDPTLKTKQIFETQGYVTWLAYINTDQVMVASMLGSVTVWELETGSCIEHHDDFGRLCAFAMAPNKRIAASLTEAGNLVFWDV